MRKNWVFPTVPYAIATTLWLLNPKLVTIFLNFTCNHTSYHTIEKISINVFHLSYFQIHLISCESKYDHLEDKLSIPVGKLSTKRAEITHRFQLFIFSRNDKSCMKYSDIKSCFFFYFHNVFNVALNHFVCCHCYYDYTGFIEFIVDPSLTVMGDLLEKILMPNRTQVRHERDSISEERNLETGKAISRANIQINEWIQLDYLWILSRRDAGDGEREFV